jgi:hypothetical protein
MAKINGRTNMKTLGMDGVLGSGTHIQKLPATRQSMMQMIDYPDDPSRLADEARAAGKLKGSVGSKLRRVN